MGFIVLKIHFTVDEAFSTSKTLTNISGALNSKRNVSTTSWRNLATRSACQPARSGSKVAFTCSMSSAERRLSYCPVVGIGNIKHVTVLSIYWYQLSQMNEYGFM